VSLASFLLVANPSGGHTSAPLTSWLRVGGTVAAAVIVAVAIAGRSRKHVRAALLGCAAGGLFGITAALTRTFVVQIQNGVPYTASHWEVYGLAVLSVTGILFTQHGFQNAPLSASLPALEATEPLVAATLGVVLYHEQLNGQTTLDNLVIATSIVAMLVCVVLLATGAGRRSTERAVVNAP
jgi:drug/metabolite transporter (DMT)-like permease